MPHSRLGSLLPTVTATPQAESFNQATARGLYRLLAWALLILALAHTVTAADVGRIFGYAWDAVAATFLWIEALEVFVMRNYLHVGLIGGLGLYLVWSELRAINLIAGLESKEHPTREDVGNALWLLRANEVLAQFWGWAIAAALVLSILTGVPKMWRGVPVDATVTLVTVFAVGFVIFAWLSPLATCLLARSLKARVVGDGDGRSAARQHTNAGAWANSQLGLADYSAYFTYKLAQKAEALDLSGAYFQGERGLFEQWTPDFAALELAAARLQEKKAAAVVAPAAPKPSLQEQLSEALQSLAYYKDRCGLLQSVHGKMRDPERTMVCDILANGQLLRTASGGLDAQRYGAIAD